uniref:lithostathine-like n=1 Tax=Euleptes europaea TaxID=460621 RepID=UPI0025404F9B|nr:lithostathine-like [Euleptes europaea]
MLPIHVVSLSFPVVPQAKAQAKSRCPVGTYSYHDGLAWFCYEFYEYLLPFEDAEAICQQNRNGGHLASLTSETQTRLVGGYLSRVNRDRAEVWIGLNRNQNSNMYNGWWWTDGSFFRYTSWLGGTPNNIGGRQLCVVLTPGSGFKSWDDATCSISRSFLCKWRAS